jgi:hypothetical protein
MTDELNKLIDLTIDDTGQRVHPASPGKDGLSLA